MSAVKYIEHIVEPDRLLLSWQGAGSDRLRRFVGELIRRDDNADLVYFADSEDFRSAQNLGFTEYQGFPAEKREHSNVLPVFMKRLPPRSRGDFGAFLTALRIRPTDKDRISDFALLGYSGAKLPDDGFTILHPFDMAVPPFEFLLNVQGYRYYPEELPYNQLTVGMGATFVAEPENSRDPDAIRVVIEGAMAGYVCRGLAKRFHDWWNKGYTVCATVERINGTADKPSIYLYVAVR